MPTRTSGARPAAATIISPVPLVDAASGSRSSGAINASPLAAAVSTTAEPSLRRTKEELDRATKRIVGVSVDTPPAQRSAQGVGGALAAIRERASIHGVPASLERAARGPPRPRAR